MSVTSRARFPAHGMLILLLAALAGPAGAGEAIQVLFLGDNGHHQPAERHAWAKDALAAHGIVLTYTDRLDDLAPDNLARYDALMVYANIAALSSAQEQAVLAFVEGGKGYLPIHCASACFGTSPALTALTGGRFKSHGTATFAPKVIAPEHPLMRNFRGYEAWDETYVHSDHQPAGRTVLAVREENGQQEPWTWVREQGKGRVFYTASGHDQRTWSHPRFQDLLARGIAWSVGGKGAALLAKLTQPPSGKRAPLRYEPRPTVQNYEKRPQAPQYQFPLEPKDSQQYIQTSAGFELQLFAAEPDIAKPIAFAWDHRGRLFVLETVDYPSTFTEPGQGSDRIRICEDKDGDGRAETFTVFADKMNIPTGLVFANGGLIVAQAPHLLFFKDTDGDDKADVREVISDGWSKGDTHAGPSNLKYGLDNQIYGAVGYSGFAGQVGGAKVEFRSGLFRMARDVSSLEFLSQYSNNTWGLGISETGELFGSTANNTHHCYTPIPIPFLQRAAGLERSANLRNAVKMDAHYGASVLSAQIRQVDVFGGYTSASGHNLYTARAFPKKYWNRAALVCEPTLHLLHQGFLERDGSGWTEHGDGGNLLVSEDEWVAPVHAEVGPDGAVWVADWYNFIIQHNPTPSKNHGGFDAKTGKGGAHENPLRDYVHGRIYRVKWTGAKAATRKALDAKDAPGLVAALADDNMFWRLAAQRLLVERKNRDVVPALVAAAKVQTVDAIGLNGGVVHALWTLHGLGALDGSDAPALAAAVAALRHPSAGVRRNAVQVLPATAASAQALVASGVLADADLNVRLAAYLAASGLPADQALGKALFVQSQRPEVIADRWLPSALTIAAAQHAPGYLAALLASGSRLPEPDAKSGEAGGANVIDNPGFEAGPTGWERSAYDGAADFRISDAGRSGRCLEIASTAGADAGWIAAFPVKARTKYRLSGWIKTDKVAGASGALFNLHGRDGKTPAVTGTRDWTRVSYEFDSGDATSVQINCLFGGWGRSTGTAWYDDLALVALGPAGKGGGPAPSDALVTIARTMGRDAPVAAQTAFVAGLGSADPGTVAMILDGLVVAWNDREPVAVPEGVRDQLRALGKALSPGNQLRLAQLAERWRIHDAVAGVVAKAPVAASSAVKPLDEQQQKSFESGKEKYLMLCMACHQPNGQGLPMVGPPLAGSEWVTGRPETLARILLHGVKGPITAAGVDFNLEMPGWGHAFDDRALADIMTYVRREWGNEADPIGPQTVKAVREKDKDRMTPWTVEELGKP